MPLCTHCTSSLPSSIAGVKNPTQVRTLSRPCLIVSIFFHLWYAPALIPFTWSFSGKCSPRAHPGAQVTPTQGSPNSFFQLPPASLLTSLSSLLSAYRIHAKARIERLLQRGKNVRVVVDALGSHDVREAKLALRKMKTKGAKLIVTKSLAGVSH